jgi:hypothetical protein
VFEKLSADAIWLDASDLIHFGLELLVSFPTVLVPTEQCSNASVEFGASHEIELWVKE